MAESASSQTEFDYRLSDRTSHSGRLDDIEGCAMQRKGQFVRGSVKIVTCRTCHSSMPRFEFESETDTGTVGLSSAARCNSADLVLAETTLDEWRGIQSGDISGLLSRLRDLSGMKDLCVLWIRRIEQSAQPPTGIPFSEFRKLYRPPVVIYACPCCADGDAIETQEMLISEFEARGGRIVALGNLVLGR